MVRWRCPIRPRTSPEGLQTSFAAAPYQQHQQQHTFSFLFSLQGEEDKVVPPNQAVDMFEALSARGLSTALVLFPGEQHGFRQVQDLNYSTVS